MRSSGVGAFPPAPETIGGPTSGGAPRPLAATGSSGKVQLRAETHRGILRPQRPYALADIPVVNVAAVDLHEVPQRRLAVLRCFIGRCQFVVQCGSRVLIEVWQLQSLVVPADRGFRHSLIEEALG